MNLTRKQIISLAIVATVIVVSIILIIGLSSSHTCKLIAEQPVWNPESTVPTFASNDNVALVAFRGYLEYGKPSNTSEEVKDIYLPLEFSSVDLTNSSQKYNMTLKTDCATLDHILRIDSRKGVQLERINIRLVLPNGRLNECHIPGFYFTHSLDRPHYKCPKKRWYSCRSARKEGHEIIEEFVAFLYVHHLEFELNPPIELVKKHQFSPLEDSC